MVADAHTRKTEATWAFINIQLQILAVVRLTDEKEIVTSLSRQEAVGEGTMFFQWETIHIASNVIAIAVAVVPIMNAKIAKCDAL